jgi:hypothetical protein
MFGPEHLIEAGRHLLEQRDCLAILAVLGQDMAKEIPGAQ